ncbi:MAG: TrkA C-terminal domain-containing protein, partial [Fusobacteriaceae bacterium]
FITQIGIKAIFKNQHNPIMVLGVFKSEVIAEVSITSTPEELLNKELKNSYIRSNYNLQILTVIKDDDRSDPVTGDTILERGDKIIVFGTLKNIKKLFIKEKQFQ